MSPYQILIVSTAPSQQLEHLLRRMAGDMPDVRIAGVVQRDEISGSGASLPSRAIRRVVRCVRDAGSTAFHRILRWFHAAPYPAARGTTARDRVREFCAANGISFHSELKPRRSNNGDFDLRVRADLIVLFGQEASGAKSIARSPSKCITTVRGAAVGGSAPRLRHFVRVTSVLEDGRPGCTLEEQSFVGETHDDATSIELKAWLLRIDGLIEVIRAESTGARALARKEPVGSKPREQLTMLDGAALEEENPSGRRFKPTYGRPWYKLAPRMLAYPALRRRNRRLARDKQFPVVILFHHVVTDRPKHLGTSTGQFLKQIRFLKRHYEIASLPTAIELLKRGEVGAPTVVLTFDDGYLDNFLCLRAVAEAENVPVTLFVCTQKVSEGALFQHDLDRGERGFPALHWDQVRYLDRHGVTIGSHTRTHLDCRCTDPDVLQSEIVGSLEDLRRELGHDVPYFSFPKGKAENMSAPARALAARTYPFVFSACGGANYAPLAPGGTFKRCSHPDSLLELELLVQSVLDFSNDNA